MPVAVALKRLVTARALFALLFAAFFFLSRLVMLTAGTLTALHRVTAAAGREGSTNACVAQAAKTARRKHRMVCEDLAGQMEKTRGHPAELQAFLSPTLLFRGWAMSPPEMQNLPHTRRAPR